MDFLDELEAEVTNDQKELESTLEFLGIEEDPESQTPSTTVVSELDDFFNDLGIDSSVLNDSVDTTVKISENDDNLDEEERAVAEGAFSSPIAAVDEDGLGWSEMEVSEKDDFLSWLENDDSQPIMTRSSSMTSNDSDDDMPGISVRAITKQQEISPTPRRSPSTEAADSSGQNSSRNKEEVPETASSNASSTDVSNNLSSKRVDISQSSLLSAIKEAVGDGDEVQTFVPKCIRTGNSGPPMSLTRLNTGSSDDDLSGWEIDVDTVKTALQSTQPGLELLNMYSSDDGEMCTVPKSMRGKVLEHFIPPVPKPLKDTGKPLSDETIQLVLRDVKVVVASSLDSFSGEEQTEAAGHVVTAITTFCESYGLQYKSFMCEIAVIAWATLTPDQRASEIALANLFRGLCVVSKINVIDACLFDKLEGGVIAAVEVNDRIPGIGGIGWEQDALPHIAFGRHCSLRQLVIFHDPVLAVQLDRHVKGWHLLHKHLNAPGSEKLTQITSVLESDYHGHLPSHGLFGLLRARHGELSRVFVEALLTKQTGFETSASGSYFVALSILLLIRSKIQEQIPGLELEHILNSTLILARDSYRAAVSIVRVAISAAVRTPKSVIHRLCADEVLVPLPSTVTQLFHTTSAAVAPATTATQASEGTQPSSKAQDLQTGSLVGTPDTGEGEAQATQLAPEIDVGNTEEAPTESEGTVTTSDLESNVSATEQQSQITNKASSWFKGAMRQTTSLRERLKKQLNETTLRESLAKTQKDVQLQLLKLKGEEGVPYTPPFVANRTNTEVGMLKSIQQLVEFNKRFPMGMKLAQSPQGVRIGTLLRGYNGEVLQAEALGLTIGDILLTVKGIPVVTLDVEDCNALIAQQDTRLHMVFLCDRLRDEDEQDGAHQVQKLESVPNLASRLCEFYETLDASKVASVARILEIFRHRESALLSDLQAKYNCTIRGDPFKLFSSEFTLPVDANELVNYMFPTSSPSPSSTTSSSNGEDLDKYFVIDCREPEQIAATGRFPTAFVLDPTALSLSTELHDKETSIDEMLQSLKGKSTICVLGSGMDPLLGLYDPSAAREAEQRDRLRVDRVAVYLLLKKFPSVCSVDGGFASCYLAMKRSNRKVSELLVDATPLKPGEKMSADNPIRRLDQFERLRAVKPATSSAFLARAAKLRMAESKKSSLFGVSLPRDPNSPFQISRSTDTSNTTTPTGNSDSVEEQGTRSKFLSSMMSKVQAGINELPKQTLKQQPQVAEDDVTNTGNQATPGAATAAARWGVMSDRFRSSLSTVSGGLGNKIKESVSKLANVEVPASPAYPMSPKREPTPEQVNTANLELQHAAKGQLLNYGKLVGINAYSVLKQKQSPSLSSSTSIKRVILLGHTRMLVIQPHVIHSNQGYVKSNRPVSDVIRLRFKNQDMSTVYLFVKRSSDGSTGSNVSSEPAAVASTRDSITQVDDPTLKVQCYKFENSSPFIAQLRTTCAKAKAMSAQTGRSLEKSSELNKAAIGTNQEEAHLEEVSRDGAREEAIRDGAQEEASRDGVQEEASHDGAQEEASRDGAQEEASRDGAQREASRDGAQEEANKTVTKGE